MKKKTSNDFNFWLPIDFMKSEEATQYERGDDRRYENMVFEGIASDSSEDYQGDNMEPNGFVIDYFLKHGLFNLDHLTVRAKELKSRFWIGEPLDGRIINNKFWVKGKLWSESPEARAFWDKCIEMKESGSTRRPGMSIEGKALERDPKNEKHITKAIINNIALTFTPVNFNSYLDFVKGVQEQDFIPTGSLIKSRLDRDIMFEKVIGDKRIVIDSKFRIIEEKI
jgi:hypothetical protein